MSPPHRPIVARISQVLGIQVGILYNRKKVWCLLGVVVPAFESDPDSGCAADEFTVVLETAGPNITEQSAYCREGAFIRAGWTADGIPSYEIYVVVGIPC